MIHNFIREDNKQIKEDTQEMKSFIEQFKALKLERDALWVKTQEDERIINDLRDVNNELRKELEKLKELHTLNFMSDMLPMEKLQKQRDEAIRLATLFQALYLRYGKAEDEHYNTVMVQGAAKSLAELKGLKYFGEEA